MDFWQEESASVTSEFYGGIQINVSCFMLIRVYINDCNYIIVIKQGYWHN